MSKNQGSVPFAVVVCLVALVSPCRAMAPRVGEVQRLTVITVSMQVGSTEKETKRVTYTPPPGWYVRGHAVECRAKTGHSCFTVNTVPQDWNFVSEEHVTESYRVMIDLAAKAHDAGLKGRFKMEQEQMLNELRKGKSSHHALVVEATAKGEGFLRGGGAIQLTVTADLVYVGTLEGLQHAVTRAKGGAR